MFSYSSGQSEDSQEKERLISETEGDTDNILRNHVKRIIQSPGDLLGKLKPHQAARVFWAAFTVASVLIGLPILVFRLAAIESEIRVYLIVIPTIFVGLAVPISLYSIRRHLMNFWVPPLQIYIVRILWMVPVYSVCTLASLYLWVASKERFVYIPDAFRQCYESYTLYNLFSFMIAYLELEHGIPAGKLLSRSHPTVSFVTHAPPFSLRFGGRYGFLGLCGEDRDPFDDLTSSTVVDSGMTTSDHPDIGWIGFIKAERRFDLLAPWRMGDEFVEKCRRGVLFYVAVMPLLALLIVILSLLGLYHEGNFSLYSPYFWIETVYFCISCWALYCLAIFFVVARHDLAPVKPLSKFLLVKGIVFFTWAQTLAISLAFYFVYDYKVRHWTSDAAKDAVLGYDDNYIRAQAEQTLEDARIENAGAVCDAVMCIEMLFFAIGHALAFPSTQFERIQPHHRTVLGNTDALNKAGADNKQWLVQWGEYWARERDTPAGTKYRNERMFGVTDVHSDTTETYRIVGEGIATEFKKMPKEFAKIAREAKSVGQTAMEKTKGGFRSTAREKGKTSESKSASSTLRSSPEKLSADARDAEARGHSAFAKILKNQSQSQKQKLEKEKGPFEEQDFDDDFEGDSIML